MAKNSRHTSDLGDVTIDFGFGAVNLDVQLDKKANFLKRLAQKVKRSDATISCKRH